jgi:hypothetical protein
MATQAANETPPAGEEPETPTTVTEEGAEATEEEAEPAETEEEGEAAAAKAAKEAEEAEAKPDGKAKPEDKPADEPKALKDLTVDELATQLTEDQLRRVGQKFANKTMAAARRAERATEEIKAAHDKLTGDHKVYVDFANSLRPGAGDIMAQLRRVGWKSFRELAEAVDKTPDRGAEPKAIDPEVAELKKWKEDRERREREASAAESTRKSQAAVVAALAKEPERFDLVTTELGQAQLWDAIVAYHGKYGSCPDTKVFEMADLIESRLTEQVSKSKKFTASPAQKGTPPATKPTAGAKGKTITNRSSSAAPSARENKAESEKERDRRINAEMRAAGELT